MKISARRRNLNTDNYPQLQLQLCNERLSCMIWICLRSRVLRSLQKRAPRVKSGTLNGGFFGYATISL